jgi:hypothetical protein
VNSRLRTYSYRKASIGSRRAARSGLQVRPGLAHACGKILPIELGEHLSRHHHLIDVDEQLLDDAVCLGFDFDLGNRLDLAGGDERARHRRALDGRQPRRINRGRGAAERGESPGGGHGKDDDDAADEASFSCRRTVKPCGC